MNNIENYLYTKSLDLDLLKYKVIADQMTDFISKNFVSNDRDYQDNNIATSTKLFSQYNLLLYPYPGMHKLYSAIQKMFYECAGRYYHNDIPDQYYYVQAWLNCYKKGQYLNWHGHSPPEHRAWHGFFCVDVEPGSSTTYRLPGRSDDVVVESKDNLLVMGPSAGDVHKSSEWPFSDRPRITIAFDIVPENILAVSGGLSEINHWAPI
jgi:hypothetical protein